MKMKTIHGDMLDVSISRSGAQDMFGYGACLYCELWRAALTEFLKAHPTTFPLLWPRLRSRRKNDTAPAPELLCFMNMAPAPELLVFMSVVPAPELSFFMAPAPSPDSACFHTLIFSIVLVCLKLNGKWFKSSTQN